jgi:putative membrane protein
MTERQMTVHYFLDTLPHFLGYFAIAAILAAVFLVAFQAITPQKEFALIREGKSAPAISLVGAFIGFAIPMAVVIGHSANFTDVLLWGLTALVVQVVAFFIVEKAFGKISARIIDNCNASGIFLGGIAIGVGILQAGCMIP